MSPGSMDNLDLTLAVDDLNKRVTSLEKAGIGQQRLGPRPEAQEDFERRVETAVRQIKDAIKEQYMPHDKHGKVVEVGQRVIVSAIVRSVTQNQDYCNVTLDISANFQGAVTATLNLNTKQVEVVEEAEWRKVMPSPAGLLALFEEV